MGDSYQLTEYAFMSIAGFIARRISRALQANSGNEKSDIRTKALYELVGNLPLLHYGAVTQ